MGNQMIQLYYMVSPMLVSKMQHDRQFKEQVKTLLESIVVIIGTNRLAAGYERRLYDQGKHVFGRRAGVVVTAVIERDLKQLQGRRTLLRPGNGICPQPQGAAQKMKYLTDFFKIRLKSCQLGCF